MNALNALAFREHFPATGNRSYRRLRDPVLSKLSPPHKP
jgi:hypothetical protein